MEPTPAWLAALAGGPSSAAGSVNAPVAPFAPSSAPWAGSSPRLAASDAFELDDDRDTRPDDDPAHRPGEGAFAPGPRWRASLSAFDPGRRGVKALVAVAAAVVLMAGFLAWRARPATEPVPEPAVAPAAVGDRGGAGAPPSTAPEVVVAVAGKVRRPGLVRLPPGARVAEAVQAAGGASPGVDVSLLNPARKVVDGELIVVGVTPPPGTAGGAQPGSPASSSSGGAAPAGGRVNLNTATLADLDSLPGVGPVLAQRILDHRERHGGFRTVADLRTVDGIGDSRYEELKNLVTV
jgi:competence protein ComEA